MKCFKYEYLFTNKYYKNLVSGWNIRCITLENVTFEIKKKNGWKILLIKYEMSKF